MVSRFDDALLRDMIAGEQRYNEKLRNRRAHSIERFEPPDVLAFYDRQIIASDTRINYMLGRETEKDR